MFRGEVLGYGTKVPHSCGATAAAQTCRGGLPPCARRCACAQQRWGAGLRLAQAAGVSAATGGVTHGVTSCQRAAIGRADGDIGTAGFGSAGVGGVTSGRPGRLSRSGGGPGSSHHGVSIRCSSRWAAVSFGVVSLAARWRAACSSRVRAAARSAMALLAARAALWSISLMTFGWIAILVPDSPGHGRVAVFGAAAGIRAAVHVHCMGRDDDDRGDYAEQTKRPQHRRSPVITLRSGASCPCTVPTELHRLPTIQHSHTPPAHCQLDRRHGAARVNAGARRHPSPRAMTRGGFRRLRRRCLLCFSQPCVLLLSRHLARRLALGGLRCILVDGGGPT